MATARSIPVDPEEAVPTGHLLPWLRDHVSDLGPGLDVVQLAGGASNLTFRISDGDRHWVVRRPPLRGGLSTAHDMTREFRVQAALAATDVPVAAMVAECTDESVLGAPFYVMGWLDGIVYDDVDAVAGLTPEESRAASFELVDVLARLHSIDAASVGLADFGRPAGFLERQLRRWTTQWEASKTIDLPDLEELGRRLADAVPAESRSSIVHGDYSFNNTMFRSDDPTRMLAALDWELSTLGDPLTDVGTLTAYWGDAGEVMWRGGTPQAHRANDGFPGTDELLERYAAATGADLDRIDVYQAFALFKLAVISQGALRRIDADDPDRVARTMDTIGQLTALALATLRQG
jgi:aminoglycoside phosphotransferase (APT) family kinase protein